MDTLKALIDWVAANGRAIWDAPLVYALTALAIAALAAKYFSWWHHRKEEALEAEKRLAEKQRDGYRTEAENYRKEIEGKHAPTEQTKLLPVTHGNTAIRAVFAEVTAKPSIPIAMYGVLTNWSDEQITAYAAAKRLEELGLAKIETQPNVTTVASTSAADALRLTFNAEDLVFKRNKD